MCRVLHILPHPGGGGEAYVDTVSRLSGFDHQRFFLASEQSARAGATSIPFRYPVLAGAIRTARLVHVHGDTSAILTRPLLARRPAVMSTHGLSLLRRATGCQGTVVRQAIRGTARVLDTVIATSEAERGELANVVDAGDLHKLRTILIGLDPPARPTEEATRQRLRTSLGIGPNLVMGLCVGQLETYKDPVSAATAARMVNDRGCRFVLAFAGQGSLAEAVSAAGGEAVRLLGLRPDIGDLMSAADLLVHPSLREGLPLSVVEALFAGLPVVATEAAGNVEAAGPAGIFVPFGDSGKLAEAVISLCREPSVRAELSAHAHQRARRVFAMERFLGDIEGVYNSLLSR